MYGKNGNGNWFTENWKKLSFVVIFLLASATGVAVPMNLIDNTNEAQDVQIGEINTWRADFYEVEWPAHLAAFGALVDDVRANLKAFTDYKVFNDEAMAGINADILVIDTWMTAFYNDKAGALGEWQEFMAVWGDFYNKDRDAMGKALGEFQQVIDAIYANYASWATAFNARILALEAVPPGP